MQSIGIAPKVLIPAVAQLVAGIVFLLLGYDVEGKTLIVTALGSFGVGYAAPPTGVTYQADPAAGDVRPPA